MSYFFRWIRRRLLRVISIEDPVVIDGSWEEQKRIFWEDITTLWEDWTTTIGTFVLWEEQTKEYWNLETTENWEDWYGSQGSLEMIEEKAVSNWEASSTNWENFE